MSNFDDHFDLSLNYQYHLKLQRLPLIQYINNFNKLQLVNNLRSGGHETA